MGGEGFSTRPSTDECSWRVELFSGIRFPSVDGVAAPGWDVVACAVGGKSSVEYRVSFGTVGRGVGKFVWLGSSRFCCCSLVVKSVDGRRDCQFDRLRLGSASRVRFVPPSASAGWSGARVSVVFLFVLKNLVRTVPTTLL